MCVIFVRFVPHNVLSVPESTPPSITYINRSFDVFVEAVFIFDVILNFRTTFVSKSGNVVQG